MCMMNRIVTGDMNPDLLRCVNEADGLFTAELDPFRSRNSSSNKDDGGVRYAVRFGYVGSDDVIPDGAIVLDEGVVLGGLDSLFLVCCVLHWPDHYLSSVRGELMTGRVARVVHTMRQGPNDDAYEVVYNVDLFGKVWLDCPVSFYTGGGDGNGDQMYIPGDVRTFIRSIRDEFRSQFGTAKDLSWVKPRDGFSKEGFVEMYLGGLWKELEVVRGDGLLV